MQENFTIEIKILFLNKSSSFIICLTKVFLTIKKLFDENNTLNFMGFN